MHRIICSLAFTALTAAAVAQSPLTTTFANNNGGSVGGAVYFDLTVNVPTISVTGLDLNLAGTGSIEVYTCPVTRLGNQSNLAAWTLVSTGTVTGAVAGTPAPVSITPFVLPAGTQGIAFKTIGVSHSYTNGTGANQTYSTAELTLNAGEAANVAFAGTPFSPRVVNCSIYYSTGGSGTLLATKTPYGTGCVSQADSCFYELFATGTHDLGNSVMSLIHSGGGYLAIPGIATYVPPSPTATALALTDDSEAVVTLSAPLRVGRSSSTSQLAICSNGFVSVASGNGTGFSPTVATMLGNPQTGWYCWHDYNPAAAGSGQVKFEEIGGIAYVTWDGVYDYGGTTSANANTFQMQFELATGNVHFAWQTMSNLGNGHLVGFSEAGASADPGNTDISVALPATFNAATFKVLPLALSASARPIQATSINLDTSNITSTAPFGAITLGLSNPAFDLTPLGMAGCTQYTDNLVTLLYLPFGSSTASVAFTIPSAIGLHIFAQSFAYDPAAGLTQLGAIASNGVDLLIGDF